MTSREGYDAYTLYLGIKLHFYSKDYDFVRYNGKVKADINSFLKEKISITLVNYLKSINRTYKISILQIFLFMTYGVVTF